MQDTLDQAFAKAKGPAGQLFNLELQQIQAQISATNRSNTDGGSAGKPLIKEVTINGELVRQILDPYTGEILSESNLGTAGEISDADRKSSFIQFLGSEEAQALDKEGLRQSALSAGVNPEDDDIKELIGGGGGGFGSFVGGAVNTVRSWLGF